MGKLYKNNELLGSETIYGTREEFRVMMSDTFKDWYEETDKEVSFKEYVEDILNKGLEEVEV